MRNYIFITLAAVSILLAGCDSESSTSTECENGAVKDCENSENGVGMVTICKDGKWSESKVECPSESGKVSCTPDNQCGECLTGDFTKCTNDSDGVGSAIVCKDGKWSANAEKCPGMFSCSMTNECYDCYYTCNSNFSCLDDCKDTTCKDSCDNLAECIKQCNDNNNGCDSKCGACRNGNMLNCKETNGVGSADICSNGKWEIRDCKAVKGIQVSCQMKCLKDYCNEDEYSSICGECLNQEDLICIKEYDDRYSASYSQFPYKYQMVKCEDGALWLESHGYTPCCDSCDCTTQEGRQACLAN